MSSTRLNPFPGLRPFRMDEKYLFFGREQQTQELLQRLSDNRFLAVVGTSGSGKSSLVQAGLLPHLYGGTMLEAGFNWEVAVMRPGGDPLTHLAEALVESNLYDPDRVASVLETRATLRRSGQGLVEAVRQSDIAEGTNLLIVVDQFEEIFRFRRSGPTHLAEAGAFVKLLLNASQQSEIPIYVALTMRSDYLGDCSEFAGLAEAVNEGEYLIPRLSRKHRRQAIVGPIKVGGGELSPRLLQTLLNDVGDNPDHLPVLQHALMRTWEQWEQDPTENEPLDLRHYEAVGGMSEALSRHADEVFKELPDDHHRNVAEKMFKALTERSLDNRGIRRPASLGRLCAVTEAKDEILVPIIEEFRKPGRTFLMPGEEVNVHAETVIDISHESLMRVWQRLDGWVEEESQSARIYGRLRETAELHAEGKAGLYHDPDLQIAQSWRQESQPNQIWAEQYGGHFESAMAFLDQGEDAERQLKCQQEDLRRRELKQAKELAETQRSAARNFKRFAASMGIVAFAAAVAFLFAFDQNKNAQKSAVQARVAEAGARRLQYLSDIGLVQAALTNSNIGKAKSLLDAHIPAPGAPDLRSWEWRHLKAQTLSDETERLGPFDNNVVAVDYSPDGRWLGICERGGDFFLWDTVKERVVYKRQVSQGGRASAALAFSPTENLIALSDADQSSVLLLSVSEDGPPRESSLNVGGHIFRLAFSPGGKYLALYLLDTVQVWDVDQGRELIPAISSRGMTSDFFHCVAISEDRVVYNTPGGNVSVHSLSDGRRLFDDIAHPPIASLATSPDGTLLATGTSFDESDVRLWDLRTGKLLSLLKGHLNMVNCLEFSSDGKWLASASSDQTIRLWDLGSWDRNHDSHPRSHVVRGNEDEVYTLAFQAEGNGTRRLASGSKGNWVRFFDLEQLDALPYHKEHSLYRPRAPWPMLLDTSMFSFSPDSTILAAIGEDEKAMLIDTVTLEAIGGLPALGTNLRGILFFPDGKSLLASDHDGTLIVYDLESDKIVNRKKTPDDSHVMPMSFSADGLLRTSGGSRGRKNIFWDSTSLVVIGSVPRSWWGVGELSSAGQFASFFGSATELRIRIERAPLSPQGQGHQSFRLLEAESDSTTSKSSFSLASNLSFSRTGKFLAAADYGGYVTIWDLDSPSNLNSQCFKTHMINSHGVEIFQDGQRLATVGRGHDMLKIWDRESERELLVYESTGYSTDLQISPDESTIAVGSEFKDKSRLHLWRAPSLDEIQQSIDSKAVYPLQLSDALLKAKALRERRSMMRGEAESLHADGQLEAARSLLEPLVVSEAIATTPFIEAADHSQTMLSTLIQWVSSPLVKEDAVWHYNAKVPNPGAAWHDPAFDDSAWEKGKAPLGFGDPWILTKCHDPNEVPTRYFRHRFSITEANAKTFLAIGLMLDDGIVLYLNGTEILRLNMPDGPVDANTFATESPSQPDERRFHPFLIPAVQLRTGENVLAAEVHNISVGSSDLCFALTMTSTEHSAESYLRHLLEREDGPALLKKAMEWQPELRREEWMRKLNAFLKSK